MSTSFPSKSIFALASARRLAAVLRKWSTVMFGTPIVFPVLGVIGATVLSAQTGTDDSNARSTSSRVFRIEIARTKTENGLVHGEIRVNGQPIGFAFENADLKIPAGVYSGILRYWSGHNFVQGPFGQLGEHGDFLLEVGGVSGRTNILLHAGNRPHQSKGCILLGPAERLAVGTARVGSDHPLYRLRKTFYETDFPSSTPDKKIIVEIVD